MLITQSLFEALEAKYGMYSSWAIWNQATPADTEIIGRHLGALKTSVVMVALNISKAVPTHWQNFHGRDHARKLMFAFNDSRYRGAYMTDIIKGESEAKSGRLMARVQTGDIDLKRHTETFIAEMHDVGVRENSLFILFGRNATQLFTSQLARIYPNYVKCTHYSMYGRGYTDAEWVKDTWRILEKHYQDTSSKFNTLEFTVSDAIRDDWEKLKGRGDGRSPR